MSVYDGIMQGLNEALEHAQGKHQLRTATITVEPLKEFDRTEIKNIRSTLGVSQPIFASIMGVSAKTVEAWEGGRNKPDGAARRLLALIQDDPSITERYSMIVR